MRPSRRDRAPSDELPAGESNGADPTLCIGTDAVAATAPTAAATEETPEAFSPLEPSAPSALGSTIMELIAWYVGAMDEGAAAPLPEVADEVDAVADVDTNGDRPCQTCR